MWGGGEGKQRGERLEKTLSVFTILPLLAGSMHRLWSTEGGLTLSWEHSELVAGSRARGSKTKRWVLDEAAKQSHTS